MRLRALISFLLVLTLIGVFAARSNAADKKDKKVAGTQPTASPAPEPTGSPEFTGVLAGTGQISVNGNRVSSGATVLGGSTIATGPDGDVMIDLGALGRIQLRPNTTIKLALEANKCQAIMERCGSFTQIVPSGVSALVKMTKSELTEVAVTRSEVRLKTGDGKDSLVKTDENTVLHNLEEVATNGDATFTVNCCGGCKPTGGGFLVAPLWGALGLVGVGAAIAVGVVVGGPSGGRPRVSPVI